MITNIVNDDRWYPHIWMSLKSVIPRPFSSMIIDARMTGVTKNKGINDRILYNRSFMDAPP